MPERWIVITLDGLANLALGPYGSSWNSTPSIDRLAAHGISWDRVIVPSDDPVETLHRCWTADVGGQSWVQACRQHGRVELFSIRDVTRQQDANRLAELATEAGFDACTLVDWQPEDHPAEEVESTALAQLVMALLDRLQADPAGQSPDWSTLWLHSDFLARHWDAPRWLFPVQELDEIEEPVDPSDPEHWKAPEQDEAEGDIDAAPPPLQETTQPPAYQLPAGAHPDWVTSWMQTYGCQVRLVDHLIQWIVELTNPSGSNVGVALLGTSGMSLGQSGWIGHRVGPIRSPQIHVPAILYRPGETPLRWPELAALPDVLRHVLPGCQPPSPQQWARLIGQSALAADDEASPQVITRSSRADRVVTTPQWFFVRDADQQVALFLKPDDRDDVNDVASLCRDVVQQLD